MESFRPDAITEEADGSRVATLAFRDMTIKVIVSSDASSSRYRATILLIATEGSRFKETRLNWPDQLFQTHEEALQHGLQVGVDTLNSISDFGASSEFE